MVLVNTAQIKPKWHIRNLREFLALDFFPIYGRERGISSSGVESKVEGKVI